MGGNGQPGNGSTIIPCLRYRDAQAAIDWLQRAFGFHAQAVYADGDTVFHAQLTFGSGMIMLGSASNQSAWSRKAICGGSAATTRGARTTASDHGLPTGRDPLRHRWLGVSRMAWRRFLPRGPAAA